MSMRTRRRDDEIAALVARVHPERTADVEASIARVLDQRERDRRAAQARRQLAARTAPQPCSYCGTIDLIPDRGVTPDAHGSHCHSCDWHFGDDKEFAMVDGRRDYAAAWLLGDNMQMAPPGLGAQLGVLFAYEVDGWQGARGPWRHLDLDALRARAGDLGIRVLQQRQPW